MTLVVGGEDDDIGVVLENLIVWIYSLADILKLSFRVDFDVDGEPDDEDYDDD